ncbi:right-handed parallel beta-helix repeat-containing protein [Candidatus Nitrotoga sp. M5]|uniref:right-handed parallel beta-helix repeat-containing protein n=1 Tax=Candidatus Nitrotoga sp. M5 TaxID=2890409 RepID=UPI001EF3C0DF|nr:right-handed parallel beta-helix repeat-containing protein [Candidatus Nitrotoga sp. M5]CAH1385723.1 Right handed beta helix region [Candidatus Nitrotoga sp. M5]
MLRNFTAAYLFAILYAFMATPAQAIQRASVASYGNDANICSSSSPCRTFAKAVTVVDPNGEVVALDSAGYGTVTLTQSISLTAAPGAVAGITVFPGTNGVTIATPGVNVVLRGLTINSQGGDTGILMTAGDKLSIENCVISNFSISGSAFNQIAIFVEAAATVRVVKTLIRDNDIGAQFLKGATADISGSTFFGNTSAGIIAQNSTAGSTTTVAINKTVVAGSSIGIYSLADTNTASAKVDITHSIVSNSGIGVASESAAGAASVSMRKNMVTGSSTHGLSQLFSGTLTSYGKNALSNNAINVAGTLTTAAPL